MLAIPAPVQGARKEVYICPLNEETSKGRETKTQPRENVFPKALDLESDENTSRPSGRTDLKAPDLEDEGEDEDSMKKLRCESLDHRIREP